MKQLMKEFDIAIKGLQYSLAICLTLLVAVILFY